MLDPEAPRAPKFPDFPVVKSGRSAVLDPEAPRAPKFPNFRVVESGRCFPVPSRVAAGGARAVEAVRFRKRPCRVLERSSIFPLRPADPGLLQREPPTSRAMAAGPEVPGFPSYQKWGVRGVGSRGSAGPEVPGFGSCQKWEVPGVGSGGSAGPEVPEFPSCGKWGLFSGSQPPAFWSISLRKSFSFDPKTQFFGPATRVFSRLAAGGKVCKKRRRINSLFKFPNESIFHGGGPF